MADPPALEEGQGVAHLEELDLGVALLQGPGLGVCHHPVEQLAPGSVLYDDDDVVWAAKHPNDLRDAGVLYKLEDLHLPHNILDVAVAALLSFSMSSMSHVSTMSPPYLHVFFYLNVCSSLTSSPL